MKWLVDECLSPRLARWLVGDGRDAIHPRDRGFCGEPDHRILRRCMEEDRVLVTHNAGDFRQLVGRVVVHPGLVILPENALARSLDDLRAAIAFIETEAAGAPAAYMINRVVEVRRDGGIVGFALPSF